MWQRASEAEENAFFVHFRFPFPPISLPPPPCLPSDILLGICVTQSTRFNNTYNCFSLSHGQHKKGNYFKQKCLKRLHTFGQFRIFPRIQQKSHRGFFPPSFFCQWHFLPPSQTAMISFPFSHGPVRRSLLTCCGVGGGGGGGNNCGLSSLPPVSPLRQKRNMGVGRTGNKKYLIPRRIHASPNLDFSACISYFRA